MDGESGGDDKDDLASGWGGEWRRDWWGCVMKWIWKLIPMTMWCKS